MNNELKLTGNITPTKIMAFVIFLGTLVAGIWLGSVETVIFGTTVSGGLLGWRKSEQRKIITKPKGR
jgi:hypothetical protein